MSSADFWHRFLTSTHQRAAYRLGDGGRLAPHRAQFEITYRCNSFCRHCCKKHTPENVNKLPPDGLTARDWTALARSLPPYTLITITGGEPLCHPEFADIVAGIGGRRAVNLLTNATLLTDEIIELLMRRRVVLLGVPIYGSAARHDAFVRMPNRYQAAVDGLERLVARRRANAARWPLLDLKTVVHAGNIDDMNHVVDLAARLGADFLTFSLGYDNPVMLNPFLKPDLSHPDFRRRHPFGPVDLAMRREFAGLFSHLLRRGRAGATKFRFYPPFPSAEMAEKFFLAPEKYAGRLQRCTGPWGNLVVNPEGDVFPCLSVRVGSVRGSSWRAAWQGPAFRDFRRAIREHGTMPACWGCCYVAPDFSAPTGTADD